MIDQLQDDWVYCFPVHFQTCTSDLSFFVQWHFWLLTRYTALNLAIILCPLLTHTGLIRETYWTMASLCRVFVMINFLTLSVCLHWIVIILDRTCVESSMSYKVQNFITGQLEKDSYTPVKSIRGCLGSCFVTGGGGGLWSPNFLIGRWVHFLLFFSVGVWRRLVSFWRAHFYLLRDIWIVYQFILVEVYARASLPADFRYVPKGTQYHFRCLALFKRRARDQLEHLGPYKRVEIFSITEFARVSPCTALPQSGRQKVYLCGELIWLFLVSRSWVFGSGKLLTAGCRPRCILVGLCHVHITYYRIRMYTSDSDFCPQFCVQ